MSQKASRKGLVKEEKEKIHTDTPAKDMRKEKAVSAEKEKQPTEKKDAEKPIEKSTEKKDKPAEKADKPENKLDKSLEKKTDKPAEKKVEKPAEKKIEKPVEKKIEKPAEKKSEKTAEKKADAPVEKKEGSTKDDKGGKSEKAEPKRSEKSKLNGTSSFNGTTNGTVSAADDDDDDVMVIDETEQDDMFPELTYDDSSEPELEPEGAASRSFTRRSQAKVTRTPETPRPASRPGDAAPGDDPKILKLKDDVHSTDRVLRSADSPKPQEPKAGKPDSETKEQEEKVNGDKSEKVEVEVVVDVEGGDEEPRKTDTNYSKSRVKVSPYRRSGRLADQTTSSMMANYTGNNTTMEMDITESTSLMSEDPSLDESPYLAALRSIRARKSYKTLPEMPARRAAGERPGAAAVTEQAPRPTAPVVGRKRKPEGEEPIELASGAVTAAHSKRVRLLYRLTSPFRSTASSTPLPARRAAEIVGINTDLPLSVPLAAPAIDPEALKPDVAAPPAPAPAAPGAPAPGPGPGPRARSGPRAPAGAEGERDKKCIVM